MEKSSALKEMFDGLVHEKELKVQEARCKLDYAVGELAGVKEARKKTLGKA